MTAERLRLLQLDDRYVIYIVLFCGPVLMYSE